MTEGITSDYLALAKGHLRHNQLELLTSIAYSLIDLCTSMRRDQELVLSLAEAMADKAIRGMADSNFQLRQRIEQLEAEIRERATYEQ